METESPFERAISVYFLFFNYRTLKFDLWRHRWDNSSTRFRAYDLFLQSGPSIPKKSKWIQYKLEKNAVSSLNYSEFSDPKVNSE